MTAFKNYYPGVLGRSESKIISQFIMRSLDRNRVYFGELDFSDLYQECVIYFCAQKEKSWEKAKLCGLPYSAFVVATCKKCLNRILRDRSSWGRREACIKGRFFSKSGEDAFADSGDMEALESRQGADLFLSAESKMIFEQAFTDAWKSLGPSARRVFAMVVNENLSNAEIGRRLKFSGAYVGMLRKKVREDLNLSYSDCANYPEAA